MDTLKLYEITEEYQKIEQQLIDSGGVITDEMEEELSDLQDARQDKIERCVAMIKNFEATAQGIESERKRLQDAEKAAKRSADSLKDYVLTQMQRMGMDSAQTNLGKVRVQQHHSRPLQVHVRDEELPEDLQRITAKADKTKIKEYMEENGIEELYHPDGHTIASLGEASKYLRIY